MCTSGITGGREGLDPTPARRGAAAKDELEGDVLRPRRELADARARWRSIEVRHLAALVGVAHEGSFRRTADRLGYVQSAISNQIAHLERAAGTRLVERASGSSTVRLTAAGQVLAGHADEIIAQLAAACLDIGSLAGRAAESVRVAGLEQFGPQRFAQVVCCFRERYPRGHLILADFGSDELNLQRLSAGAIDLVVCELPLIDGPFSHLASERDPYVLLVAAESPLVGRSNPPSASEIASLRLMIPTASGMPNRAEARLRALGIVPRSPLRPGSAASAQAFVATGLGEAIVPRSQLDLTDPRTVAIELPKLLPERALALAIHAERECSGVVCGFIRAVGQTCEAERGHVDCAAA